ncbi:prepilin-type N-terminal cleavage/methylation domain-containing protein [Candidatus Roizmanbacteria bacterium]|nr:prepilin-type N-terminal cleavage/methylation domain-containing protein [Candidatus Roizmanbacteria bacterium]
MKSGYTLTELLVTLGVLTILLGIGTLSFTTLRFRNELDLVASQVRAELLRAQSEAINTIDSGVYFEPDRFVYFQGTSYTEGAPENEQTDLPSAVSIISITFTDSTATFDPVTGYLENFSDPAQVVLSGGGETHTVSVNEWGTIAIE